MSEFKVGGLLWDNYGKPQRIIKIEKALPLSYGLDRLYYIDVDGARTFSYRAAQQDRIEKFGPLPEAPSGPEVTSELCYEPHGAASYTGGSSDYYQVQITKTTTPDRPAYIAECNDIIEALGMNFAEGNAFKALWRRAAQRTLGKRKAGAKDDGLYDAEKVEFFGARLVAQSKGNE